MAIPSEYNQHRANAFPTNMTHPASTTTVTVTRMIQETVGPLTNARRGTVLHPDMYDSDPDRGRANVARRSDQMSTWVPGLTAGDNLVGKGSVTESAPIAGQQGEYLLDMENVLHFAHPHL